MLENIPQIKAKLETLVRVGSGISAPGPILDHAFGRRSPAHQAGATSSAGGRPAKRSISWMSRPPGCTSRTSANCWMCCRAWWNWEIPWW